MSPMFSMPGGKNFQGKMIAPKFPEHRVYIEPFVGAGGIFFRKAPSEVEIINDKDSEIAFFFNYVKKYNTPPHIPYQTITKEIFLRYRNMPIPADPHKHAIRYWIVHQFSFRGNRKSFLPSKAAIKDARQANLFDNWQQYHQRLRNVTITNTDYRAVVKKYDTPDAFVYLDPPYETGEAHDVSNASSEGDWYGTVKLADVINLAQSCKGKVMISFSDNPEMKRIAKQNNFFIEEYQTIKMSTRNGAAKKQPQPCP